MLASTFPVQGVWQHLPTWTGRALAQYYGSDELIVRYYMRGGTAERVRQETHERVSGAFRGLRARRLSCRLPGSRRARADCAGGWRVALRRRRDRGP